MDTRVWGLNSWGREGLRGLLTLGSVGRIGCFVVKSHPVEKPS